MSNPYLKYVGPEDKLHHNIMEFVKWKYPKWLCTHPMNEGKRTNYEKFKMDYLGVKPGIPDILIFEPRQAENRFYCGLAIEVKARHNKPTANQINFMDRLSKAGWLVAVVYSLEDASEILQKYADFKDLKF